jgi:fatty-acyl-CoA synthase
MTCTSDAGISDAAARRWLRALELTRDISHQRTRILPLLLAEIARSRPEMPALLSHAECFTFKDLAQRANKYARWALAQGAAKGDVICLLMPNRPEYMAAWLGISSIGGIVALLNANLVGASLARCIDMAQPKHIIVTDELASQFESARPLCAQEPRVWIHSGHSSSDLALLIGRLSGEALASAQQRSPTIADPALLIYTSGTAGFPKAAYVSHERLMRWSLWFAGMMDVQPSDRLYDCLPMYHSVGGVVAPGAMLVRGASAVIAEKFSVQHFWDDIASWNCSLFQYIGELCRYLVHSPPHARERSHRLRLCCGNGLREDVWREFKRRYGIPQILEFYAATEGVLSLFNCEEKPGAIGRIPPFLHRRSNIALVQCEVETGELTRSPEGRCLPASSNEPGEAIVKVDTRPGSGARFEGYTDEASAQSKLARCVRSGRHLVPQRRSDAP